jgi:hypothetical protein
MIFGPKGDEVTGEWRKLHNEELHALYPLPNMIRMMKLRTKGQEKEVKAVEERRGT